MLRGLKPPLRDSQEDRPICLCPGCGGEVYAGEDLFEWEGKKVCVDCFKEEICLWVERSPRQAAEAMGFDWGPAGESGGTYGDGIGAFTKEGGQRCR